MGVQEDRQSITNTFATVIANTRREITRCAAYNVVLGVGTAISTPEQTQSRVFDPLKYLLGALPGEPMNAWGVIVASLGIAIWLAVMKRTYKTYLVGMYALGVIWVLFAGVFVAGYFMRLGSIFGGVLAFGFCVRHWVLARVKPWQLRA